MYSRRTGTLHSIEAQKKIESFNNELREQYRNRNKQNSEVTTSGNHDQANEVNKSIFDILINENVIILGMIFLLIAQESKDYLLIGVLAALLLLSR